MADKVKVGLSLVGKYYKLEISIPENVTTESVFSALSTTVQDKKEACNFILLFSKYNNRQKNGSNFLSKICYHYWILD